MQGISYAGSNMLILKLWSADCPPFLQAVHLSYGIGAFLSPLWVKFFLLMEPDLHSMEASTHEFPEVPSNGYLALSNGTSISLYSTTNASTPGGATRKFLSKYNHEDVQLFYPFIATAVYPILAAVLFVILYFKYPENEVAKEPETRRKLPSNSQGGRREDFQGTRREDSQGGRGTIHKAASLPTVSESVIENVTDDALPSSRDGGPRSGPRPEMATGSVPEIAQIGKNGPPPPDGSRRASGQKAIEAFMQAQTTPNSFPERMERASDRARRQSIVRRDSIITIRRPSMVCVQLYQPEIPHIDTSPIIYKIIFVTMTSELTN